MRDAVRQQLETMIGDVRTLGKAGEWSATPSVATDHRGRSKFGWYQQATYDLIEPGTSVTIKRATDPGRHILPIACRRAMSAELTMAVTDGNGTTTVTDVKGASWGARRSALRMLKVAEVNHMLHLKALRPFSTSGLRASFHID